MFRGPPAHVPLPQRSINRGYQPPPKPITFNPPRSHPSSAPARPFNGKIQQEPYKPISPSFARPSINIDHRSRHVQTPQNWQLQQLHQQHPQRFQQPQLTRDAFAPRPGHFRLPTVTAPTRTVFQGPVDPVNNIIIHLYLNAKDKQSHTELRAPPVRGVFGIGTSHGGPGTHTDPIIITKDFDRDTLEFVESKKADQMVESGPANIVEVRAMVSSPKTMENKLNKAVNTELNRAIPVVLNRMRGGSTTDMDGELRKELEEALVDELAKNLGDTIDNTEVTEEDLSKLIEEGFNEVNEQETTTTRRFTTTTTARTTQRPTTTSTTPTTTTTSTTTPRPTTTTRRTTTTSRTTTTTEQPQKPADSEEYSEETADSEEPFENVAPEFEPTTEQTPPPRTWRITTTTPKIIITSATSRIVATTTTTSTRRPTTTSTTTSAPEVTRKTTMWRPWMTSSTSTTTTPTTTTRRTTPEAVTTTTKASTTPPTTPYYTSERATTKYGDNGQHIFIVPGFKPNKTAVTTIDFSEDSNQLPFEGTIISSDNEEFSTVTATLPHRTSTAASRPQIVTTTTASSFAAANMPQSPIVESNDVTPRPHIPTLEELSFKTKKPLIEVQPARIPPHIGVVSLSSEEDDVTTSRVTTQPSKTTAAPTTKTTTTEPITITIPLPESDEERTTSSEVVVVTKPKPTSFGEANMMPKEKMKTWETSSEEPGEEKKQQKWHVLETTVTSSTSTTTSKPTVAHTMATIAFTKSTEEYTESDELREQLPNLPTTSKEAPPHVTVTSSESRDITAPTNPTPLKSSKKPETQQEIQPLPDSIVVNNEPCPTPNDPSDRNRTDVLFLLDSSNAFTEQKFSRAIDLIVDTVEHFNNIGPNGVQVSLVQYNDEPYLEFSLRKHVCKKFLIDDIIDTEYMAGGSQLGKALSKVSQFAFTKKRVEITKGSTKDATKVANRNAQTRPIRVAKGDRPDAENILIIVTDGQTDDRVQEPVQLAKENGATVLVISTLKADKNYVSELAAHRADNLFALDDEPHQQLAEKIARRIAHVSGGGAGPAPSAEPEKIATTTVMPGRADNKLVQENPPRPAAVESNGIVHLQCVAGGFKINLTPPAGFKGLAAVKGYADVPQCKTTVSQNGNTSLFVANEECGVTQVKSLDPRGLNSSLVLHLLHDEKLVTGEDRAYLLQCFIGLPDEAELSTNLDISQSELTIAETISLSSIPPTCSYSIRGNSPNGPVVKEAVVGQTIYHRWDCDGNKETNNVYGIQIHSCYASDDVERRFAFLDSRGCSSDLAILSDPTYSDDTLSAYAVSHVFNIGDAESLKFVCKLSLCTRDGDGCEGVTPPSCGANQTDLLLTRRLIRHQNSAVEEALTSALSTKVGVANRDDGDGLLASMIGNKVFWIIAAAALVSTVAIAIMAKYPGTSDASSTTTGPSSISDLQNPNRPPTEIASLNSLDVSDVQRNEGFSQFLTTFDRSQLMHGEVTASVIYTLLLDVGFFVRIGVWNFEDSKETLQIGGNDVLLEEVLRGGKILVEDVGERCCFEPDDRIHLEGTDGVEKVEPILDLKKSNKYYPERFPIKTKVQICLFSCSAALQSGSSNEKMNPSEGKYDGLNDEWQERIGLNGNKTGNLKVKGTQTT
ncbi:unnamed protein product [Caenorhabditis auriculariae]|uniref:ZP domain-containing protein n=1 Tax=Caenorhabditis auriculariae TaxID=2777116 RepID=A0A8S1HLH6_9PELO|nr:unnamed protein product [Caenorhabditis auriculariae]